MLTGSCLCGHMRFSVTGRHSGVAFCHCSICRKVSGTGSIAHVVVPFGGLQWFSGAELVSVFERPSGYGTAFCRVCGSPAPDHDRDRTIYRIPVGLFDGEPDLTVTEHIFVGSRAPWDVIGDAGEQFEGDGPSRTDFEAYCAEETGKQG